MRRWWPGRRINLLMLARHGLHRLWLPLRRAGVASSTSAPITAHAATAVAAAAVVIANWSTALFATSDASFRKPTATTDFAVAWTAAFTALSATLVHIVAK